MNNLSLYIPYVPENWASYSALKYLFEWHHLGIVKRVSFGESPDGLGIDAHVYFTIWYETQWSHYIIEKLKAGDGPVYVALLYTYEFLTIQRLDYDYGLNDIKSELTHIRREMGIQCVTCKNTNELEEDEDEYGKFYCKSCWFVRNNTAAICAKERDISEMQIKINELSTKDDPNCGYYVEELLERIQEREDEIKILRNA